MKNLISIIIVCALSMTGCTSAAVPTEPATEVETEVVDVVLERANEILNNMTLEEKVYQMMFVTPESITGQSAVTTAGEGTRVALEEYPVGGIIYFGANLKERSQVIDMIAKTQSYSEIGLFIGVDEEGGRVARLGNNPKMGTTKIGPMQSVKSADEAYTIGKTLGVDLKALGFNLDFAPVADVIVYDKNSEIGDRSFGSDPIWAGDMVSWVVKGLEGNNVSSVLKHFPGHGSTKTNSHTGKSESTRTLEQLRSCEFIPFEKGIEAGCDFVMVSHMTLTEATEAKVPSSLSREVITGLLKNELAFEGIVITDSLSMGAITKEYTTADAAVMAIGAGADMLLMPKSVKEAGDAVIKAVNDGVITEERIDESVVKILRIKIEKGLI